MKNLNKSRELVQKLNWEDVREEVKSCNHLFFLLMEELNDNQRYSQRPPIFKIRYPYGVKIVDRGVLQIPISDNKYLPNADSSLDKEIIKNLSYCSIPLSFLLNKESEIFVELDSRSIPLQYLNPGQFFGLFECLSLDQYNPNDPKPIWNVSAGARTLFMLPKISDIIGHNKLRKEFHLKREVPKSLSDHWKIFGEIANHPIFEEERWYTEILVFSDKWFKSDKNNNAWLKFKNYLLELAWTESQILREKSTFSYLWELLSTITLKNFRTKPYLIESVKNLMLIATGARPGFSPTQHNTKAAPVDILQKAYLDIYGLKNYPPILMQPKRFFPDKKEQQPVYYSLAYPTVFHYSLELDRPHRTMPEMREMMRIISIAEKRIKQRPTIITNLLNKVEYAYFHSEIDNYHEISPTSKIIENQEIWKIILSKYNDRKFPVAAPFLRGVIQIALQN